MTTNICKTVDTYDKIAGEYYDVVRHPTCANFDELTQAFLRERIEYFLDEANYVLEVGAGRSIVAPIMASKDRPLEKLTLLDNSHEMLQHSAHWIRKGSKSIVADARSSQLPSDSMSLIVSSLGDPYNTQPFWFEVRRLLTKAGICLFTTPAPEWANRFRLSSEMQQAEFVLKTGETVVVPSYIPTKQIQNALLKNASLRVIEERDFTAESLFLPPSPKLELGPDTLRLPVVRGYVIARQ